MLLGIVDVNACINLLLRHMNKVFIREYFRKLFSDSPTGNVAPCGLNLWGPQTPGTDKMRPENAGPDK